MLHTTAPKLQFSCMDACLLTDDSTSFDSHTFLLSAIIRLTPLSLEAPDR
jgi:hypothetical protein